MGCESNALKGSLMEGWGNPLDSVGKNLLSPELRWRSREARFSPLETSRLSGEVHEAWKKLLAEAAASGGVGDLSGFVTIDTYPNGSARVILTEEGLRDWPEMRHKHKIWSLACNVNSYEVLKALETALNALGNPDVVLSTLEFPGQLGDRPAQIDSGGVEVVEMQTTFGRLRELGVRGIVSCDNHSPAATWWMMEAGIVGVDLSLMPLLIDQSVEMDFIGNGKGVKFSSFDRGAVPRNLMGKFYLRGLMFMSTGALAVGEKLKKGLTSKSIEFDIKDLETCDGESVIAIDDRMVGGGTMERACEQILEHNPAAILVIAPHLYGVNGFVEAVDRLSARLRGGFRVITTDSVSPLCDLRQLSDPEAVVVLPVGHIPVKLSELVRSGLDFWRDNGLEELEKLKMCLAAWHYPLLIKDFPEDDID